MTEVGALKLAVSKFIAEKSGLEAGKVQAIAATNPVAVEEFKAKYPGLEKAFGEAVAYKPETPIKKPESKLTEKPEIEQ